jgi:uncharacterized membrane protein (DUF485 family)
MNKFNLRMYCEGCFLTFFLILAIAEFFSPFLICVLTGNWWLMFLFFVSWIPALATIILAGIYIGK